MLLLYPWQARDFCLSATEVKKANSLLRYWQAPFLSNLVTAVVEAGEEISDKSILINRQLQEFITNLLRYFYYTDKLAYQRYLQLTIALANKVKENNSFSR